jgi:hypothetical protein
MSSTPVKSPTWQCILICCGDKYGVSIINGLIDSVLQHTAAAPRFVLITDCERDGLHNAVQTVRFPDRWIKPHLKRAGCQAKLAMFERGLIPDEFPVVYIDLDTVVLGDMQQLLNQLDSPQTIAMLPSAIIPFGPLSRWIFRWTKGRYHARGNSSILVYHPAHSHFISERFVELSKTFPLNEFRPMVSDDRFISWVAQANVRTIPSTQVVKFPGEYMFYWSWVLYVKAVMPWVKNRRAQQLAVTLNGLMIKPEKLLDLQEGSVVVDGKKRKLVWSEKTLGPMKIPSWISTVEHPANIRTLLLTTGPT